MGDFGLKTKNPKSDHVSVFWLSQGFASGSQNSDATNLASDFSPLTNNQPFTL